jgi:transposase-like protein
MVTCKSSGLRSIVKSSFNHGSQKYHCPACGCNFTDTPTKDDHRDTAKSLLLLLSCIGKSIHHWYGNLFSTNEDKRFARELVLEFSDGETIFTEGEESREMYIVQSGEVQITKRFSSGEIKLATIAKGDFVGEMALLESLPRSATAKSVGKTRLVVLQPGGLLLKIRRDPTFAFEMLQRLSHRIRHTDKQLFDALQLGISVDAIQQIVGISEFTSSQESTPKP